VIAGRGPVFGFEESLDAALELVLSQFAARVAVAQRLQRIRFGVGIGPVLLVLDPIGENERHRDRTDDEYGEGRAGDGAGQEEGAGDRDADGEREEGRSCSFVHAYGPGSEDENVSPCPRDAPRMRIAVPNKGRLHEPTLSLLERAGLHVEETADRQLYADTVDEDVTVLFARAADIPEYVRDGAADLGVTGLDQAAESGGVVDEASAATEGDLVDLLDLAYGSCRLVLAAPEDGEVEVVEDLVGKTVATEFPNVTRDYLDRVGVDADVVTVTGATELTPHVDMADAIVDITSTGTTLKVNRLAVIDDVLDSSVRLFARPDVVDGAKVEQVVTAFESVLAADGRRYLMMNAPKERLDDVKDVIPGLGGPTVMDVEADENGNGMVAVHAVVDERDVFETISELRSVGATGILVTEIERLVE